MRTILNIKEEFERNKIKLNIVICAIYNLVYHEYYDLTNPYLN